MQNLPKSITWTGYGKSRLSKVSFPEIEEIAYLEDITYEIDDLNEDTPSYTHQLSHVLSIRTPVSIKNYKRTQPVLIVRKRNNNNTEL